MGKKVVIIIVVILVVVLFSAGGMFLGFYLGTHTDIFKRDKEQVNTKVEKAKDEEIEKMEKIAKIVFNYEKDNFKAEDFTAEEKINIAMALNEKNVEATGTELKQTFKEYFGSDIKLEFPNIMCDIDHGSEEQNIRYRFNKSLDKYVYNDNHPGHGGGHNKPYGAYLEHKSTSISDGQYKFTAPVIFYAGKICYDIGGCEYDAAYKSYEDAKNETNSLVKLENNKTYWTSNGDEFPIFEEEKLYNDYKDKLNTYTFIFEKENGNLIFKSYKKD